MDHFLSGTWKYPGIIGIWALIWTGTLFSNISLNLHVGIKVIISVPLFLSQKNLISVIYQNTKNEYEP